VFYALSWFLVFGLFVLWSLAAWAVHAFTVWTVASAGALTGVASGVEGLRLPEWLTPWVAPEIAQAMTSLLSGFAPFIESLLQTAPALTGGLVDLGPWQRAAAPAGRRAASAYCDLASP